MSETVVSLQAVPDVLRRFVKTQRVKIREENGIITIVPAKTDGWRELHGLLKGKSNLPPGVLVTDDFMARKSEEKELDL
jgi:hypothetical protein